MELKEKIEAIVNWAADKKAQDITVVDVSDKVYYTDALIVCTGSVELHVKAIADNIVEKAREQGIRPLSQEGYEALRWVLLDFSDVIVHIFHPQTRDQYKLEQLWNIEIPGRKENDD